MTPLRARLLEEITLRNYSPRTAEAYTLPEIRKVIAQCHHRSSGAAEGRVVGGWYKDAAPPELGKQFARRPGGPATCSPIGCWGWQVLNETTPRGSNERLSFSPK